MTDSLLSRLQSLTEPSREMDAEIFERFGKIDESHCRDWCRMDGRTDLTRKHFIKAWAPRYTASIDAALTLKPKGLYWRFSEWHEGVLGSHAWIFGPSSPVASDSRTWGECVSTPEHRRIEIPAIALLIAILKAKEDSNDPPIHHR